MRKKFAIIAAHVGIGTEIATALLDLHRGNQVVIATIPDKGLKIINSDHIPDIGKMVLPYKNIPLPVIESLNPKVYFDKEPSKFISKSKNNYKK